MKKTSWFLIVGLLLVSFAFGGGIVHNTNHSAEFIRLLARNASTDIDAVYFNPAGITLLEEGFSFYLSNQTISQERTVTSGAKTLNSDTFEGTTFAPVFPNVYAVYKTGNLAVGGGFLPIGGGGSAEFDKGLPSFEVPVSVLPASLSAAGIPTTKYSVNTSFKKTSVYYGFQADLGYKINEMLSVAVGGRYVSVNEKYEGYLKDIMINPNYPAFGADGSMTSATDFFADATIKLRAAAVGATTGAAALQPLIDAGAGGTTFANLIAAGLIDQATVDRTKAGFEQIGLTFDPATLTPSSAQAIATTAATQFNARADLMSANATLTKDKELKDAVFTGSAFTPILGVHLSPIDGLDIGVRYEAKTSLELTTKTDINTTGLSEYDDGAKSNADMPAQLALGVGYRVMPSIRVALDYNYYFNKNVNWDGREDDVENGSEIGVGAEFKVSPRMLFSAGYLWSDSGVLPAYNNDISHSFTSHTFGTGGRYYFTQNNYLSLGAAATTYDDITNKDVDYMGLTTATETYDKTSVSFTLGFGFTL